jgi:hypothetical protein
MKATDRPCGERDRAGWWEIPPTSRCPIIGGHAQLRDPSEVTDGRLKKVRDRSESAGEVAGAALWRTEAACDQRKEPATNHGDGVKGIPRLRLHLLQFEPDRSNGAKS